MKRLLLAPGPVEIEPRIRKIASERLEYFRGDIFAREMIEFTKNAQYLFQTKNTPITLASSGSGAMEMAIQNLFDDGDKVTIINGGSFGKKWVTMAEKFRLDVNEIRLEYGKLPDLKNIENALSNSKALLINMHETSTGVLYDIEALGKIAQKTNTLFIVDGISSIGADTFKMDEWHCDCAMVSSNKALACMPGLSLIVFSDKAIEVIKTNKRPRYYFDALDYLRNIPRGMTPFTTAMNNIMQVGEQLKYIKNIGIDVYVDKHKELAEYFRNKVEQDSDFSLFGEKKSNALTTIILPDYLDSLDVIKYFRNECNTELAPVPLEVTNILRVSHMGYLNREHMDMFWDQLVSYKNRKKDMA